MLSDLFSDLSQSLNKLFENDESYRLVNLYNINDENIIFFLTFIVCFLSIFVIYILAKCFLLKND